MIYEFWMASLTSLDADKRRRAVTFAGSAERFYHLSEASMESMHLFTEKELAYIRERKKEDIEANWSRFQQTGISFVPYASGQYPERLRHIYQPPYALYIKGNLPQQEQKSIAVVGARGCSEYGRTIAKKLGRELAIRNVPVISGMACGVDSAAHAGALEAAGHTYAVLGCGCDICYPRSAIHIYENIISSGGGILSEYAPGVNPLPHFFPQRNRIISGLSDIIVVVEARKKSGSLITADQGLDQGKEIYAVPGRISDPLSEGTNRLIEQGAGILNNIDSFLKNIGITPQKEKKLKQNMQFTLEKEQLMVYSCLDLHPKFINLIIEETGLNLLTVLYAVEELKKAGLIQETFQNYYCRTM